MIPFQNSPTVRYPPWGDGLTYVEVSLFGPNRERNKDTVWFTMCKPSATPDGMYTTICTDPIPFSVEALLGIVAGYQAQKK